MATLPAKARPQGRAQSPGPQKSAAASSVRQDLDSASGVSEPAAQSPRRAKLLAGFPVLAKVLGLIGFVFFFGLEWAEYCQHRSVDLFVKETRDADSKPQQTHYNCRHKGDELQCDEQQARAPDGRTWNATPSVLCPGTRFDNPRFESSGDNPTAMYRKDSMGFNVNGTHTFRLMELKIGYSLHTQIWAKFIGLLAIVLGMLVVLPLGPGILAVLLLNALAYMLYSGGVGDADERTRSSAAVIAFTLALIFVLGICKITATKDGHPDSAVDKKLL